MRQIALLLLFGGLIRHSGARWLGDMLGYPVGGMEYMLGAAFDIILCFVVLILLWEYRDNLWKRIATIALYIGILEAAQMVVCRAATSNIALVPKGKNLCDHLTGLPIGPAMVVLYAIIVCYTLSRKKETKERLTL